MGRLVRLQTQYARSHKVHRSHNPDPDIGNPFRDSIITRLEYLGGARDLEGTRDIAGNRYYREGTNLSELIDVPEGDESPRLSYDLSDLDEFRQLTLLTADGFYGISDPVTNNAHKDFRPLKLPVIDVNSSFGELGRDIVKSAGAVQTSSHPLPKIDGSFSAVKQYLEKLFEKRQQRRVTDEDNPREWRETAESAPMFLRSQQERSMSFLVPPPTARPASARSAISLVKHINDPGMELHRAYTQVNDESHFLRISSIKPTSTTLKITPPNNVNDDVVIFGEMKWPPHIPSNAFEQSQKSHLAVCSEPPPSTPESEYLDLAHDNANNVMSVAIHQQLFKPSDQPSSRAISYRGSIDSSLYRPRNRSNENFQDLRLDVVRRPLRERPHVKT